jgi:hypothetical protein
MPAGLGDQGSHAAEPCRGPARLINQTCTWEAGTAGNPGMFWKGTDSEEKFLSLAHLLITEPDFLRPGNVSISVDGPF